MCNLLLRLLTRITEVIRMRPRQIMLTTQKAFIMSTIAPFACNLQLRVHLHCNADIHFACLVYDSGLHKTMIRALFAARTCFLKSKCSYCTASPCVTRLTLDAVWPPLTWKLLVNTCACSCNLCTQTLSCIPFLRFSPRRAASSCIQSG